MNMNQIGVGGAGVGLVALEGATGIGSGLITLAAANPVGATILGVAVVGGLTFCAYQSIKNGNGFKLSFKGFGFETK